MKESNVNEALSKKSLVNENFSRIGTLVAAIQNSTEDSEVKRYAKEYRLMMLCSLAEDTSYEVGETTVEEKGRALGINELYQLFRKHLPKLRNLLADHFHRMNIEHHAALNDALVDFNLLERINTGQSSSRMRHTLTTLIAFIKHGIPQIKKQSVTYIERSWLIVNYLNKSLTILEQDSSVSQEDTVYAVALLHIAAGTCARELLAELEKNSQLQQELVDQLSILKVIRNEFAHDRILKGIESMKKIVIKLPTALPKIIQGMQRSMPDIQSILKMSGSTSAPLSLPALRLFPASSSTPMPLSTVTILQSLRDTGSKTTTVETSTRLVQLPVEVQITDTSRLDPLDLFSTANENSVQQLSSTELSGQLPEQQPNEELPDKYKPLGGLQS
jgi:hypothetical protein